MLQRSLLILLFTIAPGLINKQDYGPIKLDWQTHYKAQPDNNSNFYALTGLLFTYSYRSSIKAGRLDLSFNFKADIDKTKSWVKLNKLTSSRSRSALLNHEQGHANINYILMRETEDKLIGRRYNVKTYRDEISGTAKKIYLRYDEMQRQYDLETEHGINRRAQEKWDLFINQTLQEWNER